MAAITKEIEYINKGEMFVGMSEKALIESLGLPLVINETVIKRFLTQAISCQYQSISLFIPDPNGKHTVEIPKACLLVFFIGVDDHFSVGEGFKVVP